MIVTLPQPHSRLGLCQTHSLTQVYIVIAKGTVFDVKFLKCDFGFSTVVQHSLLMFMKSALETTHEITKLLSVKPSFKKCKQTAVYPLSAVVSALSFFVQHGGPYVLILSLVFWKNIQYYYICNC